MSDETRSGPRISVYIYDRQGQFVGVEELSEDEFAALRPRLVPGIEPPQIRSRRPDGDRHGGGAGDGHHLHLFLHPPVRPPAAVPVRARSGRGLFGLTMADGTVEVFRDRPAKFLCVEPDPETGAMRPVTKLGRPVYLYLCREEREAR